MQCLGETDDGEPLFAAFMPSLIALLVAEERKLGRTLDRSEAENIRDAASVVAAPRSALDALEKSRGYRDIDPERCHEEYLRVRDRLPP